MQVYKEIPLGVFFLKAWKGKDWKRQIDQWIAESLGGGFDGYNFQPVALKAYRGKATS